MSNSAKTNFTAAQRPRKSPNNHTRWKQSQNEDDETDTTNHWILQGYVLNMNGGRLERHGRHRAPSPTYKLLECDCLMLMFGFLGLMFLGFCFYVVSLPVLASSVLNYYYCIQKLTPTLSLTLTLILPLTLSTIPVCLHLQVSCDPCSNTTNCPSMHMKNTIYPLLWLLYTVTIRPWSTIQYVPFQRLCTFHSYAPGNVLYPTVNKLVVCFPRVVRLKLLHSIVTGAQQQVVSQSGSFDRRQSITVQLFQCVRINTSDNCYFVWISFFSFGIQGQSIFW